MLFQAPRGIRNLFFRKIQWEKAFTATKEAKKVKKMPKTAAMAAAKTPPPPKGKDREACEVFCSMASEKCYQIWTVNKKLHNGRLWSSKKEWIHKICSHMDDKGIYTEWPPHIWDIKIHSKVAKIFKGNIIGELIHIIELWSFSLKGLWVVGRGWHTSDWYAIRIMCTRKNY